MAKFFITFGGPTPSAYNDAVSRICKQAIQCNFFDKIIAYSDIDLQNDDFFWKTHGQFITENKRGYGYWLWKPYIIKKTLALLNDGDYLMYLDCGCEINSKYKHHLDDYLKIIDSKLIISTAACSNDVIYTKKDLVHFLHMENDIQLLYSSHIQAGTVFMKKCDIIVKLYEEYFNVCGNYHLLDDSPSIEQNNCDFVEHRHDQSVFNLLVKRYNLKNDDLDLFSVLRTQQNISNKSTLEDID